MLLDRGSLDTGDLDFAALDAACAPWRHFGATPPSQTAGRIAEARIVATNKLVLDAADMDAAPVLRLICITATDTNTVDLEAARGIAVANVTGHATPAVVQHVFALMLDWAVGLRQRADAANIRAYAAGERRNRVD